MMSSEPGVATQETPGTDPAAFEALERAIRQDGPSAALGALITDLEARRDSRSLLDALLLKARLDLGLPAVLDGPVSDVAEPARTQYEDRYVEAIRRVGSMLLADGDLVAAWPYYRAIGEKEPVAAAIDAFQPAEADDRLGQVVEIAFNGGANPKRGFELILQNYGTCSAITAFDGLPAEEPLRSACAEMLIRQLHAHLVESLRADIARRGQPLPPEGTGIAALLEGRDWLMEDDAYHIDVSHLASVVRMALMATDREAIRLAVELTDYGRRLSDRHRYDGELPFEKTYEDHAVYLKALLGDEVDAAMTHFRAKLPPPDPDGGGEDSAPAQVLVRLLAQLGRFDDAIELSSTHLAGLPDSMLFCPSLPVLCRRAGRLDRLAAIARERGDLVSFAAALSG